MTYIGHCLVVRSLACQRGRQIGCGCGNGERQSPGRVDPGHLIAPRRGVITANDHDLRRVEMLFECDQHSRMSVRITLQLRPARAQCAGRGIQIPGFAEQQSQSGEGLRRQRIP